YYRLSEGHFVHFNDILSYKWYNIIRDNYKLIKLYL
ncbi:MAG: hypothetical protein CI948_2226, partial [Halanaerobium sp.]